VCAKLLLGAVIPCWNGDGVFTGLEPHTPQENSSKNAERRTIKGHKLNKNNIKLNRKILSDLATNDLKVFESVIKIVQK